MKKLILSILAILLFLSAFTLIACNGDDNTTTDDITTTVPPTDGKFSSKTDIKTDWSGKTLNIACSTWSGSAKAPWSVIELCVDYGKESGFGTKIDAAVLERQELIKETYGVDLNWINATRYGMHDVLQKAIAAGDVYYDLALPRAMRVQSIVANGSVYDLANRDYIDFSNYYYNKDSVETYTAKGHTFFVDGDFSTLGKETASVLYFNKELLGGEQATSDLYQKVREGKWTWGELVTLASAVYKDDGDGSLSNSDILGLGIPGTSLSILYYYFGAKQADVNDAGEWEIALNVDRGKDVVDEIITLKKSNWCGYLWGGSRISPADHFKAGYMLFYDESVNRTDLAKDSNVGIVPFPMLNEEQGRYYAHRFFSMMVLMCIPKNTQDRAMSEYFLDVLAWTGNEYVMKAYLDTKSEHISDEDMEMLTDYIFPNIVYDAGAAVGWDSLMNRVFSESDKGNVNNFDNAYAKYAPGALETIKKWNTAWGAYTES